MTVWLLSIFQSGRKQQCSKEESTEETGGRQSTDLGRVWNQSSSRINVCRVRTRWYLLFQRGNYLEMEAWLEHVTLRHVWESVTWSGEVAQCFKALALAEDQSLVPEPHGCSQLTAVPVPGVLMPSFHLCGHCTHKVHIYPCKQTLVHIN